MAAQIALRHHLRRALSLSTAVLPRHVATLPSLKTTAIISATAVSLRSFHSTPAAAVSSNDKVNIDRYTILCEEYDLNHWLVIMDFGKDPQNRHPPERMVKTFIQTCAQVLGSEKEAKKRMYACSTSTYTGFQVEVDQDTAEKFKGLPGVIFVVPDTFIDPVSKEYGGDKLVDGEIISAQADRGRSHGGNQYSGGGLEAYKRGKRLLLPQQENFPPQQSYSPQQNYEPSSQVDIGMSPGGNPYSGGGLDAYKAGKRLLPPQLENSPLQQSYSPCQNYRPSGQADTGMSPISGLDVYKAGKRLLTPQQENFLPQQSYSPRQNYGPSGQADTCMSPGGNQYSGGGLDVYKAGRRLLLPKQENFPPQQSYSPRQNYGPSGQADTGMSPISGLDAYKAGKRLLTPLQENFPAQQSYSPWQNYGPSGQADTCMSPGGNQYSGGGLDAYKAGRRLLLPQQENFPSQQSYSPRQNYGPSGQADTGMSPGGNQYSGRGSDAYKAGQRLLPPLQENFPLQQSYSPQQNYGPSSQADRGMPSGGNQYSPPQYFPPRRSYSPQQNYGPSGQADRGMSPGVNQYAGIGMDGYQGGQRNLPPQQENFPPQQNYGPSGQADRGMSSGVNQYAGVLMDGYQEGLRHLTPQQQNFPPQQNFPSDQNFGPSGEADGGMSPGVNQYASVGMDGYQGGQRNLPPQQRNFIPQHNYSPHQINGLSGPADGGMSPGGNQYSGGGLDACKGGQRNLPPQQGNYNHGCNHPQGQMSNVTGNNGGLAPVGQCGSDSRDYMYPYNHHQGPSGNLLGDHGGYAPPELMGISSLNKTMPATGAYGQTGSGSFQQSGAGQGPNVNNFGHGAGYTPQGQMSNVTGNYGGSAPSGQHPHGPRDHGYTHPQGLRGILPIEHGGYAPSGPMGTTGNNRTNFPSPVTGAYWQTGAEYFQQSGAGQGPTPNSFGHGAGYPPRGEDQRFQPASNLQSNPMGPGHYSPGTQIAFNQGRPGENSYVHGARYTSHGEQQRFPPASNEQSSSTEHGNYPPGTQTGFNQAQ